MLLKVIQPPSAYLKWLEARQIARQKHRLKRLTHILAMWLVEMAISTNHMSRLRSGSIDPVQDSLTIQLDHKVSIHKAKTNIDYALFRQGYFFWSTLYFINTKQMRNIALS